jgi:hypothetical protein
VPPHANPFQTSGPLRPAELIDREREARELFELACGGHSARLVAPRRYGKTSLCARVLAEAVRAGMPTAHVDLLGVLSLAAIVTRIERAYRERLRGPVRRVAQAILRSWNLGVSLGGGGFAATVTATPRLDVESVLLRVLELPAQLARRTGTRALVVFDEVQDVLHVDGADGIIRSVIQHQTDETSYLFVGSSPSLTARLFGNPSRPFLDHAVPVELGPLPLEACAEHIDARFAATGRNAGSALDPLVELARGHPQRTMLLAHHLWAATPEGATADERTWVEALERAYRSARPHLEARWEELPVNEKRMALALATAGGGSVYEERVYRSVGLKRGSIRKALETLEGRGDAIRTPAGPRLTDPLLELWLSDRGIF